MEPRIIEEGPADESEWPAETPDATSDAGFIDLRGVARLQASSEDPSAPLVDAFAPKSGMGWRARIPGAQTIEVVFDEPRDISRVRLVFEPARACTHEFTVSWWSDALGERRVLVRQQFNFHEGAMREVEDYRVELPQARGLQIRITPDIAGGRVRASLRQCRIW